VVNRDVVDGAAGIVEPDASKHSTAVGANLEAVDRLGDDRRGRPVSRRSFGSPDRHTSRDGFVRRRGVEMEGVVIDRAVAPRLHTAQLVGVAADTARYLLDEERLRHTEAVARRAQQLAPAVEADQVVVLIAAAWLHDIGYAEHLRSTGFHPLDGARHLLAARWPPLICDLVAYHSGARFVAAVCGLSRDRSELDFVEDRLSDALTTADQTVGPNGSVVTIDQRIADMLRRHGPDSPNVCRGPYLHSAHTRVDERLGRLNAKAAAKHQKPRDG